MRRTFPFRVDHQIGQGGMGAIWAATHVPSGGRVALKVITSERATSAAAIASIRHEAQAAARLNHPGIVTLLDYGTVPEGIAELPSESPWLAMELADGGSLESFEVTSWLQLRTVLCALLGALAHAHARGQLHRDLKPENVLCFGTGNGPTSFKLSDFGIAHAIDAAQRLVTREVFAASAGTPHYMPPEQVRGEWRDFGAWTDLYALGCVAYQLAVGQPAYGGRILDILFCQLSEPLPSLEPRFQVPREFEEWLTTLTHKTPASRYQCAADAAAALAAIDDSVMLGPEEPVVVASETEPTLLEQPATLLLDDAATRFWTKAFAPTDGPRPVGTAERRPARPLPATWDVGDNADMIALPGSGLGLFGLRESPLVGRRCERNKIWSGLVAAAHDAVPQFVEIRGGAGVGKTRLATWMAERAAELGAARIVVIRHGRVPGPDAGLAGLVRAMFGCAGLNREEAVLRIRGALEDVGHALAQQDAAALGNISNPSDDGPAVLFSGPRDKYVVVARALRALRARPWFVIIDDAHWASELMPFVSYLSTEPNLPALIVLTVRDDLFAERRIECKVLETLHADGVAPLDLGPLDEQELTTSLTSLLPLEASVPRLLHSVSNGNPLVAMELLGEWVAGDAFVQTDAGLTVDAGPLPASIDAIWTRRWIRYLQGCPDADFAADVVGLAAATGYTVDRSEYASLVARIGLGDASEVLEDVVDAGLWRRTDAGWAFAHIGLHDTVVESTRERGRWLAFSGAVADMLEAGGSMEGSGFDRRLHHLIEAGRLEEAITLLPAATRLGFRFDSLDRAVELLALTSELLDRAGYPDDAPERLAVRRGDTVVLRELGDSEDALVALDDIYAAALERGLNVECAACARGRGAALMGLRRVPEALEAFERALEHLADENSPLELGLASYSLGGVLLGIGETGRAKPLITEGRRCFQEAGEDSLARTASRALARLEWIAGRVGRAEEILHDLLVETHATGDRYVEWTAWTELGEIARHRGDFDEAVRCYQNSLEFGALSGRQLRVAAATLNIALCEIGRGRFAEALPIVAEATATFEALQAPFHLPFCTLASACCAGAKESWDEFDRLFDDGAGRLARAGSGEPDHLWLLEQCAALVPPGSDRWRRVTAIVATQREKMQSAASE